MAKKKIVSAKTGEVVEKETSTLRKENRKKGAKKFRIPAIILWVAAIGFEVVAILLLRYNYITPWLWIALGIDAACCIIGSLLWKKANRISPCTSDSKAVCFFWNQLGVIACLLAFIPFGIILLSGAKNLDPKLKKILLIVTGVLVLGSVGASIDYNPPTEADVLAAEEEAAAQGDFDGTVYWTMFGKSYHLDPECFTLSRSTTLFEGTIEEAFEHGKTDPCDFCAGGDQLKQNTEETQGIEEESLDSESENVDTVEDESLDDAA